MTSRPNRNPWTSATLLLGLLACALVVLDRWPSPADSTQPLTRVITAQLTTLRIERNDRLQLAFTHRAGTWRITHPIDAPADPARIAQLLVIAGAPVRYRFPADGDLARYGLDEPAASMRLDDTIVLFGRREPTQSGRYALVNGQIAVIDEVFYNLLSLPSSHFIGD